MNTFAMTDSLKLLEFDRLLCACAGEAASDLGTKSVTVLEPLTDPDEVRAELDRVSEMVRFLESGDLPMEGVCDIGGIIAKIAPGEALPDREDYLPLKDFLAACGRLRRHIHGRDEPLPGLEMMTLELGDFDDLTKRMEAIFDPSGDIRDGASTELRRIRENIAAQERRLREIIERVMHRWQAQHYTQEDAPTYREGRILIPVKAEHRGRVEGIVQDESSSGATVFVEPLEAIEVSNTLRRLENEERREILRILSALCDRIRSRLPEIKRSLRIITALDNLYARAKFSLRLGCVSPVINDQPVIQLVEARHPLLVLKRGSAVVPLTLTLGGEEGNILVITGPNAGGKTVALKTVGLLCLMAACGMHVPAKEGTRLPVFASLHCDIGDPQSLEQDLSTFTSHLMRLKNALGDVREPKLVLLDEFGSGTDPAEGSAIARAALLEFRRQGALVIVTTHQGTLKAFAHETGGIFNGSMEFDRRTLTPTFRFRAGIPGSSYALEISARVGLDPKVLDAARRFLGEETTHLEELISRLNESLRLSERNRREADLRKIELEALLKLYRQRLETVQKAEKERLRQAAREAKDILAQANRRIEAAVREIRESQASREAIRKAHQAVDQERAAVEQISASGCKPEEPKVRWTGKVGDWVKMQDLKDPVPVLALRKDGKEAKLEVGGVHLWMDTAKLRPAQPPGDSGIKADVKVTISTEAEPAMYELDLRGMLADEAESALEKYLSDCTLSGWKTVRIIHGKGTGALRARVQEVLKRSTGIKSFRYGRPEEGEFGVTIVELE